MSEETKKCSKCGEVKLVILFSGRGAACKACRAAYAREYLAANRERICQRRRELWINGASERAKNYRKQHADDINKQKKNYRDANVKRILEKAREYREKNKEKIKQYKLKYVSIVHPWYAASLIGIKLDSLPQEIIELKREQLQIHRIARELKNTVKEIYK